MASRQASSDLPRLYEELADWFHLLTAPADYAEEAAFYRRVLNEHADSPPRTLLELGAGGGNNASHMKAHLTLTLTDRSPSMLKCSRRLNPDVEHLEGDMRTLRLGRSFDAVFIHDAIMYLTDRADLRRAFETALAHCRPGGAALFAPDHVRENFRPGTSHGGHDGTGRGLRYLQWVWDPDPSDTTYRVDFAYLLREGSSVRVEYDRHVLGLFSQAEWLGLLSDVGFEPQTVRHEFNSPDTASGVAFVGVRPGPSSAG